MIPLESDAKMCKSHVKTLTPKNSIIEIYAFDILLLHTEENDIASRDLSRSANLLTLPQIAHNQNLFLLCFWIYENMKWYFHGRDVIKFFIETLFFYESPWRLQATNYT